MTNTVTTKSEIISSIKAIQDDIIALGVRSLGLFGSFAKERHNENSDVDILVDFLPDQHTFDNFMELAFMLEQTLGRPIELVTRDALSPYIGPHILKEVEDVPLTA
ncbi:MAG: nucleotidyltransferase family protein [Lentisphaerae bacterium]|nr:nucleotidyltransferase family protein [Lentisphaerota bacterium]